MADSKTNLEQTAAELDDQLSHTSAADALESDDSGDSELSALETSLDTALADAESRMKSLMVHSDAPAVSIDELDEHLADSTPDDLDIRAEVDPSATEPETASAVVAEPETESEAAPGETLDSVEESPSVDTAEASTEVDAVEEPAAEKETEIDADPAAEKESLAEEAEARSPEASTEQEPAHGEHDEDSAPESSPTKEATDIDEREVLLGSDAELEPVAPKRLSVAKALMIVPQLVSSPLVLVSPDVRDMIGWFALVTAFNAVALWAYILLLL